MDLEIIYADKDLIVVNKPSGIAVHGATPRDRIKNTPKKRVFIASGAGGDSEETLVDMLKKKFPEIATVGDEPSYRPGLVHRLDKYTSGVMVVARNQKSFEAMKHRFKNRLVEKTYYAIVCGALRKKKGVINFPIGRLLKNPVKRGVAKGKSMVRAPREAVTEYTVLKEGREYSLLELHPKTGRMHQIRVHLQALGHPVACDRVYGGNKVCCPLGASRQLLHAHSLSFSFPEGRRLHFEVDIPEDFVHAQYIIFDHAVLQEDKQ